MQIKTAAPPDNTEKKQTVTDICLELQKVRPQMVADYKRVIQYTGSLVSTSMAYAYAKGISDATNFILTKKDTDEKTTGQD